MPPIDAITAISTRRSTSRLGEPAPTGDDLTALLEAAACAPDHGELRPWRFVVLAGDAKDAFGAVLEDAYRARCAAAGTEPVEAKAAKERTKLGRAPLVVVVAAVRREATVPWDEQVASAAAACQNVLVAATALGYGSMWRTGEPARDERVKAALGLRPDDAVVGFLYLGTHLADSPPRPPRRPDLTALVHAWHPA
ncbi:MAG: nitroreductase [Acidimicrobiales bacterium]|nr:nitroreductase [Acidimicrobiales bacterium]